MEIKKFHLIGIGIAIAIIGVSFFFMKTDSFFFIMGIGFLVGIAPIVFSIIYENKENVEKEEMFLEFARNLVESVKTGTPISKSIINMRNKNYGVLGEHIKKLANQISLGIPLNTALQIFSRDAKNKTISRALTLIGEAERAGGDIGGILESVAGAVNMSDKLKKERKAAISTLVIQGYIIFFIFMIIILVMQFKILPMMEGIQGLDTATGVLSGATSEPINQEEISRSFLYLLLIQGLFSGLVIGKLSEGTVKTGIKHSFALMLSSFLITTGANLFLG